MKILTTIYERIYKFFNEEVESNIKLKLSDMNEKYTLLNKQKDKLDTELK